MKAFRAPRTSLGHLDADAAAGLVVASADLALVLDEQGAVRDVSFGSDELARDLAVAESWVGRPWIEAALEYTGGTHDYEDIVQGCYEARMQLWPAERAAAITEVIRYPKKKVLHVFLAGGEMKQLLDMIADAAEWGRQHGCEAMTMAAKIQHTVCHG